MAGTLIWLVLVCMVQILACGRMPDTSGEIVLDATASPRAKLDILLVVDSSPSMCRELRQLGSGLAGFATQLSKSADVDAQIAVTAAQQVADKVGQRVVGRFRHKGAMLSPRGCNERIRTNCLTDAQCSSPPPYVFAEGGGLSLCQAQTSSSTLELLKNGKWRCVGPKNHLGGIDDSKVSNLNCSLNTYCEAICGKGAAGDELCCDLFQNGKDCTIRCADHGDDSGVGGCSVPPDTTDCPPSELLPSVVTEAQPDLLRCIATVEPSSTQESKFEGGMRAAWKALDPKGPNCDYNACVASLQSCCVNKEAWCTDIDPVVSAQNKARCEIDKVELCEYLTPFGHCKRKIGSCCLGPHDEACTQHRDPEKCAAEVKAKCDALRERTGPSPEACQNTRLVRKDARLLIVFISDRDDCSLHPEIHPRDKGKMTQEIWRGCRTHNDSKGSNRWLAGAYCLVKRAKSTRSAAAAIYCPGDCDPGSTSKRPDGTLKCPKGCGKGSSEQLACQAKVEAQMKSIAREAVNSWRFAPPATYAQLLYSLKDDPEEVYVAAITGDSVAASAPQRDADRVAFYRSLILNVGPGQLPYVCTSDRGEAAFGARYLNLTTHFGPRGMAINLCQQDSFESTLKAVVSMVLSGTAKSAVED